MIKRIVKAEEINIKQKSQPDTAKWQGEEGVDVREFTNKFKEIVKQDIVANMIHPNDYIRNLAIEIWKEDKKNGL